MKRAPYLLLAGFGLAMVFQGCKQHEDSYNAYPQLSDRQKIVKDYALCSCIKAISRDDSLKNDISFSIFRELSEVNADALKKIDSLSEKVAANVAPSQIADYNGKKPYLKTCIDYYHSQKLDSLVTTFR